MHRCGLCYHGSLLRHLPQALLLLALFLLGVASRRRGSSSDAILAVEVPHAGSSTGGMLSIELPRGDSAGVTSSSAAAVKRSAGDVGAQGSSNEGAGDGGLAASSTASSASSASNSASSAASASSSERAWPVDEDADFFGPDHPSGGSNIGRASVDSIASSSGGGAG